MKRILLSLMTMFMFACQTETVSLRFFFQDGSGFSAVVTVDAGTVLTPTDPKRDGFVFQGWFTRPAGGEKVDFSLPMTQNRDFYAQWKQNTCFVIFHSSFEGDDRVFRQEFPEHGEERLIPNPFVREGYRFLGWSDSPGSTDVRWADRAVFTMETSDSVTVIAFSVGRSSRKRKRQNFRIKANGQSPATLLSTRFGQKR